MKPALRKTISENFQQFEKKLPLEKFIPTAFLIFLLCVLVLSIITYRNIQEYQKDIELVNKANEIIKSIDKLNLQLGDLYSGRRSYIISGERNYLSQIDSVTARMHSEIARIKVLTGDDIVKTQMLLELNSLFENNLELINSSVGNFSNENKSLEMQMEFSKTAQKYIKEFKSASEKITENEISVLNKRIASATLSNKTTQYFILITGLFTFSIIALSIIISNRLIRNKSNTEKLLLNSYEELEDKVEERTLELLESNKKLTEEVNERKKNESFLKIQYEVSKTLAEAKTIEEASKGVLKNICSGINWNFGILWSVNKDNFKVETLWSENEDDMGVFTEMYDKFYQLPIHRGLPGTVLRERKSKWIKDISLDKTFIRKEAASKMGWNSGLGIPVYSGDEVIAIIECFNRKSLNERGDLIEVLESAGRQIGNFIERKNAEEQLKNSHAELEEKVTERTNELALTLSKLLNEVEEKEIIQNRIKLFAHAIRTVKDCIYITDLDNKTIFLNQAFEETYGFTIDELQGKEIPILSDEPSSPNLKNDIMQKSLKEGWKGELVTFRKDGSRFYTFLSTSSIRNDEGITEAIVGICQDITELKNSKEILNKKNNLLTILNDVIRFTNRSFDLEAAIKYSINKVCLYTKSDVGHCFLKKSEILVSSKIWNDDLSETYSPFKKFTEETSFEKGEGMPGIILESRLPVWRSIEEMQDRKRYKRANITGGVGLKTGIWVPVVKQNETIGVLEFFMKEKEPKDEEVLECIVNIGIEIGSLCEKLDTIEQIKKSEKFLSEAQHIAKLGSWEWDVVENKITWSDELYSIYELAKDEFVPTYEEYTKLIHPEDTDRVKKIIADSAANGKSFTLMHRLITNSGKLKTLKAQGEIFSDESGKVVKMFGTAHDITEIQMAEEELRKLNQKLIDTQKELIYNEKLAALGRFSSGVAHEIRNPLANIQSLAQMLLKTTSDEKSQKKLKYIITNSEAANSIIRNLLNFASPGELTFSNSSLADVMNTVIESIEARCQEKNIKIVKEIPGNLPMIYIDKTKLGNAFMNFVSNSIDSMPGGGILTVTAFIDSNAGEVKIDFIDTGIGIPPENMDKILEPFFTTKDEGVGLGMGLAHQTIKQHRGTFEIKSIVGSGTHIEIRLSATKLNQN